MSVMYCKECDRMIDTDFDLDGTWTKSGDYICTLCTDRIMEDCTCKPRYVRPNDISPPEGRILDKWCPVHGKDPDAERDRLRELNQYPQERDDAEV